MSTARDLGDIVRVSQTSMASPLQAVVFLILAAITAGAAVVIGERQPGAAAATVVGGLVVSLLISSSIKVANQWQRGIVLRLGQFRGTRGPGLFLIVLVFDRVRMIDTRVLTHHIREQEVITRDNVPVTIDSV